MGSHSVHILRNLIIVLSLLFLFFLAIELMGAGFGKLSQSYVNSLIQLTSNPFITLFIGLLATAILQSSSTTTTMAVALVAVESLTVEQAIPMIIGANVGTTITSTLVSLGYITKTAEFKKAVSAGVCHDLYNIIMAAFILPLELKYKLLSETSRYLSEHIPGIYENKISIIGVSKLLYPITNFVSTNLGSIFTIIISLVLLFSSVKLISNLLYNKWIGKAKENVDNVFFNRNYKSFGFGLLVTSIVQSSSLTTSLVVPLAATGKVNIKKAFYFILGSNLGTTLTAIIAALFRSEAAMSLAIAHFLFNMIGSFLFLSIPVLPSFTIYLSEKLGLMTLKNRIIGFSYILLTFFLIPFALIYFNSNTDKVSKEIATPTEITAPRLEE